MRLRSTRDEPIFRSDDQSKDDDVFDDQLEVQHADDDDRDADGDATSDDDDAAPDPGGDSTTEAKTYSSQPKKQRNTGAGMIQSRKTFHDIPHYPLETRIVTRVYAGPLRRYARYSALRDAMYGPEYARIKVIWDLEIRWADFPVLPPRLPPEHQHGVLPSPWLPSGHERGQEKRAFHWYDDVQISAPELQRSRVLAREEGQRLVPQVEGDIVTLVGPWDRQKEVRIGQGGSLSTSPSGLPVDDPDASNDRTPSGWTLNVGGIPLAMSWAALSREDIQVLAVATIPFSDQEPVPREELDEEMASRQTGCIQLWEFVPEKIPGKLASPSARPPRLLSVKCFNWGRPKRLAFCPVPLDSSHLYGLLAFLNDDGSVRVIDAKVVGDEDAPLYEDYDVSVTCLTWVNTNRISLGHSDGSITLWSIYPRQLLQRVGAHTTNVIDICSAYPSNPYLVASIPVGGCATLTDLSQPSSEVTYFPVPAISFQPNLLCWNESMQGLHGAQKGEPLRKLKIFEHEYRPIDQEGQGQPGGLATSGLRGAARILQGFLPEENDDPRTEKRKEMDRKKRAAKKKKASKKKAGDEAEDREAELDEKLASRVIIHEPLTRVTTILWNPNVQFSCWAACAMASGLIKVMDLGVE
ncbi:hypothetical protein CHGG_04936 [Chaetomium globosum CBS 148.51]|uniref:Uncharacterized protein n=1 Tax=Chaetomium globosum (strain ATCC 6205 / CBS 148.51 / DSM 1962 / NBRC 6347 / NRRL 1970) TaxID=306901 RepID=Q2GZW0_CHAGB|nr:uncharacterized protein CHGG_04936 [Chaetomium globosum CBS 148.51]EAQ88317.1 hypothetical protein CHGG_04936 [Chaetomium globosum CBS 148.51]